MEAVHHSMHACDDEADETLLYEHVLRRLRRAQAAAVAAEVKAKADAESIAWEAEQSVKDAAKLRAVDAEIVLAAERVASRQAEEEASRAKKADG